MHRIYFDTNEGPDSRRYALWLRQSLEDMAAISDELHDGLHVIIYMTDELEMEAILEFDNTHGAWMAKPIKGTEKYYS
jgi:hypothetical protein